MNIRYFIENLKKEFFTRLNKKGWWTKKQLMKEFTESIYKVLR